MTVVDLFFVGLFVFLATHSPRPVHGAPQNWRTTLVDLDSPAKDTENIY